MEWDLENQESGYGPRYNRTQGFNLLQMSPNWFLGNRLKWALKRYEKYRIENLSRFLSVEIQLNLYEKRVFEKKGEFSWVKQCSHLGPMAHGYITTTSMNWVKVVPKL
jgi:hypothetical protein